MWPPMSGFPPHVKPKRRPLSHNWNAYGPIVMRQAGSERTHTCSAMMAIAVPNWLALVWIVCAMVSHRGPWGGSASRARIAWRGTLGSKSYASKNSNVMAVRSSSWIDR
jgi:hypothetical protein